MNLKRFDLIFVRSDTLIGRTISKITKSQISHVAVVWDNIHIIETDWKTPLSIRHLHSSTSDISVYRYNGELTDEQMAVMEMYLRDNLLAEYDTLQSLTLGLHILFGLPVFNQKHKLNCTEKVREMYKCAGIELTEEPFITPVELSESDKLIQIY